MIPWVFSLSIQWMEVNASHWTVFAQSLPNVKCLWVQNSTGSILRCSPNHAEVIRVVEAEDSVVLVDGLRVQHLTRFGIILLHLSLVSANYDVFIQIAV